MSTDSDREERLKRFCAVHSISRTSATQVAGNHQLLVWAKKLAGVTPPQAVTKSLTLLDGNSKPIGDSASNDDGTTELSLDDWSRLLVALRSDKGLRVDVEVDWLNGPGRLPGRANGEPMGQELTNVLSNAAKNLRLEIRRARETNGSWVSDVIATRFRPDPARTEAVSSKGRTNLFKVGFTIRRWELPTSEFPYERNYDGPYYGTESGSPPGFVLSVIGAGPAEPGRLTTGIPGSRDFVGQPRASQFPFTVKVQGYHHDISLTGVEWLGVGWDQL